MRPLSSSPQQEQHMDDVFSANVSRVVARCAQVCTSVFRVCTVCARVSESVVHGVHSVQNVLSPDGGFQRVFCEVCAHLQNVSDSVAELDAPRNPFDDSDVLCACQEKQLRTGFQPVEQKRNRRQIRELNPSGAVRGRIWPNLAKSGAPAAILINAYSGDFCHLCCQTRWPRNHSCTTQEHVSFFRDIFGHFRKFRLFRHFDTFCSNLQILWNYVKKENSSCADIHKNISTNLKIWKTFRTWKTILHMFTKCKCTNLQMCKNRLCTKCANLQRKYFSKCRNHKSALCTKTQMHISAHVTISEMQNSQTHNFFFICVCKYFLCTKLKLL